MAEAATKSLNLALQGGGAHGAFTWGVLDRLLEEERIAIEGISATSAGAMNATVLAHGLTLGGRAEAKAALEDFWHRISVAAQLSPLQPSLFDKLTENHSLDVSPAFVLFDLFSRVMSPYQFNPLNYNPLKQILCQVVDFERLRRDAPVKLHLCATNVRTGKVRIFKTAEITADVTMASGCLPFLFHTVIIDGEPYWDGGYMGNPALFPLIYECGSPDILIVHINPLTREEIPRTATDILNRLNEITFNSSLMREMRAIAFVTRLIDEGKIINEPLKRMLIHAVDAEDFMCGLSVSSKMNADWDFLTLLRDVGRRRAADWIDHNFDKIGVESTIDIRDVYL